MTNKNKYEIFNEHQHKIACAGVGVGCDWSLFLVSNDADYVSLDVFENVELDDGGNLRDCIHTVSLPKNHQMVGVISPDGKTSKFAVVDFTELRGQY